MNHLIKITKSDGSTELFEEDKLVNSLKRAGASDEAIDDIVEEIGQEMWDGMPTLDIYHRAFALLKKHHHPTALKYSVRRAMFELGPDGFPFERFVARVFKMWGYEAVTDQTLLGTCVEHEVDVVAWNSSELAMAEVKFHNEIGLKSDLKVALYVKSRFDDLADTVFDYGGVRRKLSKRFLFTNTKFSEAAIQYGTCKDITMFSWNYPHSGNLHEIIEGNGLYPITCLTTLTHQQKKDLINLGILVCIDLAHDTNALTKIGMKAVDADKVIEENKAILAAVS